MGEHVHGPSCQQFELYASEATVPQGRGLAAGELQAYVDELRESDWWRRNFPQVLYVEARAKSGGAASVGGWFEDKGAGAIDMLPCHMTELYVLHEISHVLAAARFGSHSHDPWFAQTYLQLVYTQMGSEAYGALVAAFDRGGIDYDTADQFVPAGRQAT